MIVTHLNESDLNDSHMIKGDRISGEKKTCIHLYFSTEHIRIYFVIPYILPLVIIFGVTIQDGYKCATAEVDF